MDAIGLMVPHWLASVPPWLSALLAIGILLLARQLWVELGARARQIRTLRGEREAERRAYEEWACRHRAMIEPDDTRSD